MTILELMTTGLSRMASKALEPGTPKIPEAGFGRIRGLKPRIARTMAVPFWTDDEAGPVIAGNARTRGVNPPMAGRACPFPESDGLRSIGDYMIFSMTTKEGGAEVTIPRRFCRYSSQSFLDPTDIALQLALDWVARGHRLVAMQSSLHTISLSIWIIPQSSGLWTYARSTLQSNRACLSLLSKNKQLPQSNPEVPIPLRSRWLS